MSFASNGRSPSIAPCANDDFSYVTNRLLACVFYVSSCLPLQILQEDSLALESFSPQSCSTPRPSSDSRATGEHVSQRHSQTDDSDADLPSNRDIDIDDRTPPTTKKAKSLDGSIPDPFLSLMCGLPDCKMWSDLERSMETAV
jgi:hypothetical protein